MSDDLKIFKSEERTKFFEQSGLPFWDAFYEKQNKEKIYYPYALYTCNQEPKERIKEIEQATVLVAQVFDKVAGQIQKWKLKDIEKWHFDPRYFELLKLDWDHFFCFRAGWGWIDGQLKLMEINSQTPSFWFEPELGNKLMTRQFKLKDPNPNSQFYLRHALNQSIEENLAKLPGVYGEKPRVGFVTCNWYEDLHIMRWLSKYCNYDYEVLHIEDFDITKKDDVPMSRVSHNPFDVLVFWYPIEWLFKLKFKNGDSVWQVLLEGMAKNSFRMAHAVPSFFIQSKAVLAYITENEDKIFTGKLKGAQKYFSKTYLTPEPLGENYCAKPIWGREGRGSFIMKNNKQTYSRYQEDYYVKQPKIYQELLQLPVAEIGDKKINVIYEAWVYRVDGKFVPGAIGTRGSEHLITDDFSYWLPIGV